MDVHDTGVNASRRYDATRRRERSDARREATLDVAERLFLRDGYGPTTVASIAREAQVSPATVYKCYEGKVGLLRALCQRALRGSGVTPAEERSDALHAGGSVVEVLEGWQQLVVEVAPRILPLLIVLNDAAAAHPEARELRDEVAGQRLARMADNARALADAQHLASQVSVEEVRDVLWLATSPENYDLLVRQRGWSIERYSAQVTRMVRSLLLFEERGGRVT